MISEEIIKQIEAFFGVKLFLDYPNKFITSRKKDQCYKIIEIIDPVVFMNSYKICNPAGYKYKLNEFIKDNNITNIEITDKIIEKFNKSHITVMKLQIKRRDFFIDDINYIIKKMRVTKLNELKDELL